MRSLRQIIAAIEPWYHWGRKETDRVDATDPQFSDESWGEVSFFASQWLGLHFSIEIGRAPRTLNPQEIADRRDHLASRRKEA